MSSVSFPVFHAGVEQRGEAQTYEGNHVFILASWLSWGCERGQEIFWLKFYFGSDFGG